MVTSRIPFQLKLRRRGRRRAIVALLLAALGFAGAAAAYATWWPQAISVPDLAGVTLEQASTTLAETGLTLGVTSEVFDDQIASGSIVSTRPDVRTQVERGTAIDLVVSKGVQLFAVPDMVGLLLEDVQGAVEAAGFSVVIDEEVFDDEVEAGAIVSREPDVDRARRGTAFAVVVSRGPEMVAVPDTTGLSPAEARATLEAAGFEHTTTVIHHGSVPDGTVIGTDPAAGTQAGNGSTVTIEVSKGPRTFEMPDFVGLQLEVAKRRAADAGLVVQNTFAVPGSGETSGHVQGQNPAAGTTVREGTKIDLWYAA